MHLEGFGTSHSDPNNPGAKQCSRAFELAYDYLENVTRLRYREKMMGDDWSPVSADQGPTKGWQVFKKDADLTQPPVLQPQRMTAPAKLPQIVKHIEVRMFSVSPAVFAGRHQGIIRRICIHGWQGLVFPPITGCFYVCRSVWSILPALWTSPTLRHPRLIRQLPSAWTGTVPSSGAG